MDMLHENQWIARFDPYYSPAAKREGKHGLSPTTNLHRQLHTTRPCESGHGWQPCTSSQPAPYVCRYAEPSEHHAAIRGSIHSTLRFEFPDPVDPKGAHQIRFYGRFGKLMGSPTPRPCLRIFKAPRNFLKFMKNNQYSSNGMLFIQLFHHILHREL